jgi:integrase
LRRSEALALRWGDCDFDLGQINVNQSVHRMWYGAYKGQIIFKSPKSKKGKRMISLPPSASIVLREYHDAKAKKLAELDEKLKIKDSDLVFCHPDGSPLLPDSVTHAWMVLAKRTGLKGISLHSARHTHATMMLKADIHPKIVQERLGHSSIKVTLDTYSSVVPGLQEAAAARFDQIVLSGSKKPETETAR